MGIQKAKQSFYPSLFLVKMVDFESFCSPGIVVNFEFSLVFIWSILELLLSGLTSVPLPELFFLPIAGSKFLQPLQWH